MAINITAQSQSSMDICSSNAIGEVSWSISDYGGLSYTQVDVFPTTGPRTTLSWQNVTKGNYTVVVQGQDSRTGPGGTATTSVNLTVGGGQAVVSFDCGSVCAVCDPTPLYIPNPPQLHTVYFNFGLTPWIYGSYSGFNFDELVWDGFFAGIYDNPGTCLYGKCNCVDSPYPSFFLTVEDLGNGRFRCRVNGTGICSNTYSPSVSLLRGSSIIIVRKLLFEGAIIELEERISVDVTLSVWGNTNSGCLDNAPDCTVCNN